MSKPSHRKPAIDPGYQLIFMEDPLTFHSNKWTKHAIVLESLTLWIKFHNYSYPKLLHVWRKFPFTKRNLSHRIWGSKKTKFRHATWQWAASLVHPEPSEFETSMDTPWYTAKVVVVGGWTNPFEPFCASQIGSWNPKKFGVKRKTSVKPPTSGFSLITREFSV